MEQLVLQAVNRVWVPSVCPCKILPFLCDRKACAWPLTVIVVGDGRSQYADFENALEARLGTW